MSYQAGGAACTGRSPCAMVADTRTSTALKPSDLTHRCWRVISVEPWQEHLSSIRLRRSGIQYWAKGGSRAAETVGTMAYFHHVRNHEVILAVELVVWGLIGLRIVGFEGDLFALSRTVILETTRLFCQ